jgi:hypothetical protein
MDDSDVCIYVLVVYEDNKKSKMERELKFQNVIELV